MSATKLLEQVPAEPGAGPAWLTGVRRAAAENLRSSGLPHRKVEAWRFTPVKPIVERAYGAAGDAELPEAVLAQLPDDGAARLYLVNGKPVPGADLPKGVEALSLDDLDGAPDAVSAREHFAALNAAMFTDSLVLRVARGVVVEQPIHVVHVSVPTGDATVCYPRILVLGGENSQAQLVETYLATEGTQLCNAVTEVLLDRAAQLEHTRVQLGARGSSHVATLAVQQDAASVYRSRSVSLGGDFARVDIHAQLAGEGAECALDGVYHTAGKEFCDHHTFITHAAPRCSSSETYRGIVDDASHAIFDGTIVVSPGASGTSAHQENRNLLLSNDATIHTKPHLEIDTDDLVASHGATVGALDDNQLFYLRARGVDESLARAALTYGFVAEVIEGIRHEPVARWLGAVLRDRLPDGVRIQELLQ